jgi:hypothetical protein
MGLTRPTAAQINTVVTTISDPITVLNKGATAANIDVGFIINRNGGALANTAIFWNESANTFVTAFTTASGATDSNISISTYANLQVNTLNATFVNTIGNIVSGGNVTAPYFFGNGSQLSGVITSVTKIINGTSDITAYSGGNVAVTVGGTANTVVFTSSNIYVAGSIIPTANIAYDLGSPTRRFRSAYFSGNTIYLGGAVLSSSGNDIVISTTGGFGVPVGTTGQRTATQGALRFNTDTVRFESYDGTTWNTLAYGSVSDFPSGDYGDITTITTDAFGVASATTFDCSSAGTTTTTDLGVLT